MPFGHVERMRFFSTEILCVNYVNCNVQTRSNNNQQIIFFIIIFVCIFMKKNYVMDVTFHNYGLENFKRCTFRRKNASLRLCMGI